MVRKTLRRAAPLCAAAALVVTVTPAAAVPRAGWNCNISGSSNTCSWTATTSSIRWAAKMGGGQTWEIVDQTTGTTVASGTVAGKTTFFNGTAAVTAGDTLVMSKGSNGGEMSAWNT